MTIDRIQISGLAQSLSVGRREVISLVGGGGKTTALFALGRQLSGSVLLSTTTKMGSDRRGGYDPLIDPGVEQLAAAAAADRVVLAWKLIEDHRAVGFPPEECDSWAGLVDYVVLEADGSRRRPFKAPAAHEPVIPASTSTLVACVGAAAFDAPIVEACHRPEIVARVAGCETTDRLTPDRLAEALLSSQGSRKHCPPKARFVVLLNRVAPADEDFVDTLARHLDGRAPVVAIAPFAPEDSPEV